MQIKWLDWRNIGKSVREDGGARANAVFQNLLRSTARVTGFNAASDDADNSEVVAEARMKLEVSIFSPLQIHHHSRTLSQNKRFNFQYTV